MNADGPNQFGSFDFSSDVSSLVQFARALLSQDSVQDPPDSFPVSILCLANWLRDGRLIRSLDCQSDVPLRSSVPFALSRSDHPSPPLHGPRSAASGKGDEWLDTRGRLVLNMGSNDDPAPAQSGLRLDGDRRVLPGLDARAVGPGGWPSTLGLPTAQDPPRRVPPQLGPLTH